MAAALDTGQLDAVAVQALVNRCSQGAGAFASAQVSLSVYEPCGTYRVETSALTPDTTATATGYFEVRCVQFIRVDTTQVLWGELTPGVDGTVTGDWSTATTDALTVENLGSGGASIGVRFAPMVHEADPASAITEFGASFGRSALLMTDYPGIAADTDTWFVGSPDAVLCTADTARLDLTAVPAVDALSGNYAGTLSILSRGAGADSPCNNDAGTFGGWTAAADGSIDNQRSTPVTISAPPLPPPPSTTTTTTTTVPPSSTTTSTTTTTTVPPSSTTTTTTVPPSSTTTTTTTVPPSSTTTTTVPVYPN